MSAENRAKLLKIVIESKIAASIPSFGSFQGHKIYASREVAEKIEIQTRYAAELYNVDVRQ
jgi:hypothetical protein